MDINVNIKIDAPGLAGAIQSWADAFNLAVKANAGENSVGFSMDEDYEGPADIAPEKEAEELEKETEAREEIKKEIEAETETETEEAEDIPQITLETVRAKLAALSQSGKQKEVKDLITSFKAKKLTEIPQEKYPELLKKAEDI